MLAPLLPTFERLRHLVLMDDGKGDIPADLHGHELLDYEELLAAASPVEFHIDDEHRAASMCYTSGTTGNPKGVVYTHRSTFLHTMGALTADSLGARESDVILPVVPMFHANAWGLAHAGVAAGSTLVMPGPDLSGRALADLIVDEKVTVAAGVPTIWMQVLPELKGRDTSSLRAIPCGGSAVPKALSEAYRAQLGQPILQAWGMTETSPIAAVCRLDADELSLPDDEQAELRTTVGRINFGVECRVVAPDTTDPVPWDGESSGELQCRGNWIASTYYDDPRAGDSFTDDGWLRTGDVATMDAKGRIRLVDRTKDLIKSGGEWISSVELENELMAHPSIKEAAVIGVPHPRWSERPLACVVLEEGATLTQAEVIDFLASKVAKWQLPDDVVFIDEVPKTSVGKFSKKTLRDRFAGLRAAELTGQRVVTARPALTTRWRNCWVRGSVGAPKMRSGGPSSRIRPSSRKHTRSAISRANPISWVANSIVMPSRFRSRTTSSTSPTSSGSSADVISSSSMISGCIASERAIATRCC